jgi:hypothetical protein
VVGSLIGGCHVLWVLLIITGWAQPILDFVFWAHMIQPVYVVKGFDLPAALTLIGVTSLSGYAFGVAGAALWKKLHNSK